MNFQIKRKNLVKLAFKALNDNGFPDDVTVDDRKHMLYAACTMDYVALGAWAIDKQCGCLVGTMMLNEGQKPNAIAREMDNSDGRDVLAKLGCDFDDLLNLHLRKKYAGTEGVDEYGALVYGFAGARVEVID